MAEQTDLLPSRFLRSRRRAFLFAALALMLLVVLLAIFEYRGPQPTVDAAARKLLELAGVGSVDRSAMPFKLGSAASWEIAPALVIAGIFIGVLMGMLGMGGGVFKVSCMLIVFEMDIFFARAVSIVTMFFASGTALWHHLKTTTIRWTIVGPILLGAIPGAVVGAEVGNYMQSSTLTHIFGLFTLFLAFSVLGLVFEDPDEGALTQDPRSPPGPKERRICHMLGAVHGLVSGLLGISGGVIACPTQQMALRIELREAIANTLLASAVVTGIASVLVVWTGVSRGDYLLSDIVFVDVLMGIGCCVGGPIGARLSQRCPVPVLHVIDFALVFGSGLSILF